MEPNNLTPAQLKLRAFQIDLDALCDKYCYELKAVLNFGEKAIIAELRLFDIPPKPDVVEPATPATAQEAPKVDDVPAEVPAGGSAQPEAPATETPAPAEGFAQTPVDNATVPVDNNNTSTDTQPAQ